MRRNFQIAPQRTTRQMTGTFFGYDHHTVSRDGAFFDTKNLTTARFPLLAVRKERGTVMTLTAPQGLIEKDALCWVDGGTLYVNGQAAEHVTGLAPGEKQLVSMGAYIVIFPDKVYYNTADETSGSLEASYTRTATDESPIRYTMCRSDGTDYTRVHIGDEEPESSAEIDVWISTGGGSSVAMSWSASYGGWVELETVYTKLLFQSKGVVPAAFAEGDGVTIEGAAFEPANGEKILYAVGGSGESGAVEDDFIVIVGLLEGGTVQQDGTIAFTQTEGSVSIERKTPDMDFVCEAQNRLWGCFYGVKDGQTLNEIYCCALGDFKNWRQYRGLSTDSWAASVGSDGQWTGAVNYLGSPVFFKENRIHLIGVSSVGAHTIQETVCRGVQKGSWKSLVVVNETLFYKSRTDVCAWQGGFPQGVSDALGDALYYEAAAGAFGGRYYLSMRDGAGAWHLFVYDIEKGIWMREDALHALQLAKVDDELYAVDAASGALLALNGSVGTPEGPVEWYAETGLLTWEYPDRKYVSRYDIRLKMAEGASAKLYIEYDSSGAWIESGSIAYSGIGTVLLPVRPRRCDHLRLKIAGSGATEILSVARTLETGSNM